ESLGLPRSGGLVSLLPGSRPQEVAHNLPPLVDAADRMLKQQSDLRFVLAVAPALDRGALRAPFGTLPVTAVQGQTHAALGAADMAIVASGTATVEAALLETPMIVVYRMSPLTYGLGRPFVNVPHFAMANLIAGRRLVPELIQKDFTGERVAAESIRLIEDGARIAEMRDGLREVRIRLGGPGASAPAAGVLCSQLAPS